MEAGRRNLGERRSWRGRAAGLLLVVVTLSSASASADPASDLSAAESRVVSAEAERVTAEERLAAARAEHVAASARARPVASAARARRARVRELRSELSAEQRWARGRFDALQEARRDEEEAHDEEVATTIGLGIAALLGAAIAIGWGWFRASPPVAWLAGRRLGQALGLCLGGGLFLLVVGAALSGAKGVLAALGTLVVALGLLLPVSFLLARHSVEVERGNAKPLFKRERLPAEVRGGVAALFLVFFFGALGSAIFSDEPTPEPVPARLRERTEALTRGPGAQQLAQAEARAGAAQKRAARPLAQLRAARVAVRDASRQLRRASSRLVDAEADERRFASRLAAHLAREERVAAREAEQAEREAEDAAEAEEELSAGGCDPNYSGCVPAYPPDVDCDEVGETVAVYGADPHGLDADGDGSGCE